MKQYVVDAFTDKIFAGNPAAVCVMEEWLPDFIMQKITIENNLSETAFVVKEGPDNHYHLRWFTPGGEIDLCGHATLATAYVITSFVEPELEKVEFDTLSGLLTVEKKGSIFELDFPSFALERIEITDEMTATIGVVPSEAYIGDDLVLVFENETVVREAVADQTAIAKLPGLGLHITSSCADAILRDCKDGVCANDEAYDCVTRSFFPKLSIAEDPVCGRGHCHVVPLWAEKLGNNDIIAYQASKRGGELYCRFEGKRTILGGQAALFSIAELNI